MSLRIVAGELGGRRLRAPRGRATRPTREAVREAWFSALGDRVRGSRVLDLFAGSGALGLEALSRGASLVHFVESDREVIRVLERNVRDLAVEDRAVVRHRDAVTLAQSLARAERLEWDIVLADPPYSGGEAAEVIAAFQQFAFAAILCVEHSPELELAEAPEWQRRYGETTLSFFLNPAEGAPGHE